MSVAGVGWRVGGLAGLPSRGLATGQLAGHIKVPGERGWCRAESRGTGWAALVEAWTGRCPV